MTLCLPLAPPAKGMQIFPDSLSILPTWCRGLGVALLSPGVGDQPPRRRGSEPDDSDPDDPLEGSLLLEYSAGSSQSLCMCLSVATLCSAR